MTGPEVVRYLTSFRMATGQEADFQLSVAEVLERAGLSVEREYDLGPGLGRIDFYLRATRVGLELKVKGSPTDVARQLLRYAASREIEALVLVTGRHRLGQLPSHLGGKPLYLAAMWRGGL